MLSEDLSTVSRSRLRSRFGTEEEAEDMDVSEMSTSKAIGAGLCSEMSSSHFAAAGAEGAGAGAERRSILEEAAIFPEAEKRRGFKRDRGMEDMEGVDSLFQSTWLQREQD